MKRAGTHVLVCVVLRVCKCAAEQRATEKSTTKHEGLRARPVSFTRSSPPRRRYRKRTGFMPPPPILPPPPIIPPIPPGLC